MKSRIWYITKLIFAACVINLLVGCTDSQGNTIPWRDWMFGQEANRTGSFLTIAGQLLGGPWGYALAGLGAATGPAYKWFKHDKSATGLIQVTQEARAALSPDARKVYDDKARELMNNAKSGNLRAYVRDKKTKLRRAGKMALDKFSDKHI